MATQTIVAGTTSLAAFAAGEVVYILEGGQSIVGSVDQKAADQAATFEVAPGFTGQIGTAASPHIQAYATRLIYAAGAGDMYYAVDSATTDTTALLQVLGGGHMHIMAGGDSTPTITRLEQLRGTVTLTGSATPTVTTARCAGGVMNLLDAGSGTTITTVDVMGGHCYCQRPVTTLSIYSGTLIVDSDDASATNAIATLNVRGGNVVLLDPGTISTLNWFGGTIVPPNSRPVTISASTVNRALPGASQLLDHPLITWSSNTNVITDGRPV